MPMRLPLLTFILYLGLTRLHPLLERLKPLPMRTRPPTTVTYYSRNETLPLLIGTVGTEPQLLCLTLLAQKQTSLSSSLPLLGLSVYFALALPQLYLGLT